LLDQGKVRTVGVSNFSVKQMAAFGTAAELHLCQPPYNIFEREIEKEIMPYCHHNRITLITYGALCRGMLSGKMSPDRIFMGDDLRQIDPKFRAPRFGQYLMATSKIGELSRNLYGKDLLPAAVRWILDQGVDIAIWGARRPAQLRPVEGVFGWEIENEFKMGVEKIVSETITDPVGPEFMTPPPADGRNNFDNGDSVEDDLTKVL
jgi:aryl-alcohol dehydrogenase-like predicted oxidoreductase